MAMWKDDWGCMGTARQKSNKSALFAVDGMTLD
jgi:hypothetical protein